jgi:hypothetical protein
VDQQISSQWNHINHSIECHGVTHTHAISPQQGHEYDYHILHLSAVHRLKAPYASCSKLSLTNVLLTTHGTHAIWERLTSSNHRSLSDFSSLSLKMRLTILTMSMTVLYTAEVVQLAQGYSTIPPLRKLRRSGEFCGTENVRGFTRHSALSSSASMPQHAESSTSNSGFSLGKPFSGLIADFERRLPYYKSDWTDGFRKKSLAAILFLYFACLGKPIRHQIDHGSKVLLLCSKLCDASSIGLPFHRHRVW